MAISTLISAEEFDRLSQESEVRLEYLDGEVIELSIPRPRHALIIQILLAKLNALDLSNKSGLWIFGSEFRLRTDRRVIPDLAFLKAPKPLLLDVDQTSIV